MAKKKSSPSDTRGVDKPAALQSSEWPIEVGKLMKTPVFRPTEEEFADFYAYAQKLDRLVGHVGVCKVIPPEGWKPRAYDVYNLKDSTEALEEAVTVKKPIRQNAIGGKGLYLNLHEEKRSMTLKAFKKATQEKPFRPPVDATSEDLSEEDLEILERRFWKNVLFSPPMYGADCPAPQGFRKDGREGLFDPEVCGSWDLAKLPSLLNFGLKKRVPGVNTSFIYVGMYRAAFAWHCEDMDLHSINYLHWGAPKTWYTVPATHAGRLEEVARRHFPVQARECSEFLRHKTNIIDPAILLKAGIPLTRTVQKARQFIINFPGAYHSGFNNGYNCAESCNFATEYWIPFGVQAKPCSCASKQNSVRIDVDAILNKVKDVKVKGEQWVQCELCSKWRLLPPFMMHLIDHDQPFQCNVIEGMTCGKKEQSTAGDDGQWEVDGKVQLGLDPGKEQWVMCERCKKWRRIPAGVALDADAVFVCSVLEGGDCAQPEEQWEEADDGQGWQMMDMDERRSKYGEWTAADEEKQRVKFIKEELAAYGVVEFRVTDCGDDRAKLEALLEETAREEAKRWQDLEKRWPEMAPPQRESSSGNLVSSPARASAASVAQRLLIMETEMEDVREQNRRDKRKRKLEELRAEEARAVHAYTEEVQAALKHNNTPLRCGSMSPSRAGSPAAMHLDRTCDSPIPNRSASPVRPGSPMLHPSKRLRFHRQTLTVMVVCFGHAPVERTLCKDDKTYAQMLKLVSPTSREAATIHLPVSPSHADQRVHSLTGHTHHGPYTLATPSVTAILATPPSPASHVHSPGALLGGGRGSNSVFVRVVASGGREESMLNEYARKLEETRGDGAAAPFAQLLQGVELAVGSWQEEGAIEEVSGRGRGDGLMARVATKRVVSVVESVLREANHDAHHTPAAKVEAAGAAAEEATNGAVATVKSEAGAGPMKGGTESLDTDTIIGVRGWTAPLRAMTERFWQRAGKADSVELRPPAGHAPGATRRVLIVHAPALPPRSPQTKPRPLAGTFASAPPAFLPPSGAASRFGMPPAHLPPSQHLPAHLSLSPSGMSLFGSLAAPSALRQMQPVPVPAASRAAPAGRPLPAPQ